LHFCCIIAASMTSSCIAVHVPITLSVFRIVPSSWEALMNTLTITSSRFPSRSGLPHFFWGSSVISIGWLPHFFVICLVLSSLKIGIFSSTNSGLLQIREKFIRFKMSHCSCTILSLQASNNCLQCFFPTWLWVALRSISALQSLEDCSSTAWKRNGLK